MRTIRLYGELGDRFGRSHEMEVASIGEAIRALSANFAGFRNYLSSSNDVAGYEVWDGSKNLSSDDKEHFIKTNEDDIKIIPVIRGASNTAKLIIGVILIALAYYYGGPASGAKMSEGWAIVMNVGISLTLSGIIGLMTKTASGTSIESNQENSQSYIFSGTQNTTKQGNPVFVAYGTHLLGSQIISASVTTHNI